MLNENTVDASAPVSVTAPPSDCPKPTGATVPKASSLGSSPFCATWMPSVDSAIASSASIMSLRWRRAVSSTACATKRYWRSSGGEENPSTTESSRGTSCRFIACFNSRERDRNSSLAAITSSTWLTAR